MDMNDKENWGARIERGMIDEVNDKKYKVKSICRDGVKTPWIETLSIAPKIYADGTEIKYEPTEYAVGDMVYFFMFADGRGAILGKCK